MASHEEGAKKTQLATEGEGAKKTQLATEGEGAKKTQLATGERKCTECSQPAVPYRKRCNGCIEKGHKRYWQAIKAGLCSQCWKPTANGKRRCDACTTKMRDDCKRRYAEMVAKGFCTYCRKHRKMPHRLVCFGCYQKQSRLNRARRLRQLEGEKNDIGATG